MCPRVGRDVTECARHVRRALCYSVYFPYGLLLYGAPYAGVGAPQYGLLYAHGDDAELSRNARVHAGSSTRPKMRAWTRVLRPEKHSRCVFLSVLHIVPTRILCVSNVFLASAVQPVVAGVEGARRKRKVGPLIGAAHKSHRMTHRQVGVLALRRLCAPIMAGR